MHVPLNRDAVRDAMPAFFDLLREEPHPAVRVVLPREPPCALFNAQSLDGIDGCRAASRDHPRNASGDHQNYDRQRHHA